MEQLVDTCNSFLTLEKELVPMAVTEEPNPAFPID